MQILLSFTGFHDPFSNNGLAGDFQSGPILTVVAEGNYDQVYLFSTPKLRDRSKETQEELKKKYTDLAVEVIDVPLKDPTNYSVILKSLRSHFKQINSQYPEASYFISVASGTPQMHASWLILAASNEIPATILQSFPPEFVPEGKSQVKVVDLQAQGFPHISTSIQSISSTTNEDDLIGICQELGIVGEDAQFMDLLKKAKTYAEYDDLHFLLLGETGTGKEYITRFIQRVSPRFDRPFVTVNCSSIPDNLSESQLFGYKKGAFTGAVSDQPGKFKSANGGVLFLDEVGELSLPLQAKLLRALDQGEIEPVGSSKTEKIDVRVVAATNRNLREMVSKGTFREDLYQRFGATLKIPALRQRKGDISKLALHILNKWNAKHKKQRRFTPEALKALISHPWTGNIRELHKVITNSAMLCSDSAITDKNLIFEEPLTNTASIVPEPEEGFEMKAYITQTKQTLIKRALEKTDNNQAQAARLLSMKPQALNQFLKRNPLQ